MVLLVVLLMLVKVLPSARERTWLFSGDDKGRGASRAFLPHNSCRASHSSSLNRGNVLRLAA